MHPLLEKIAKFPKAVLSVAQMARIIGRKEDSLRVTLHRLVKRRELVSLGKGLYRLEQKTADVEHMACELGYPAYLSCEWALASQGLLHQIPYQLDVMTTGRSRSLELEGQSLVYHHLQKDLFWGYQIVDGKWIAEAEKAILDLLYLERYGLKSLLRDEINWKKIDHQKLLRYAKRTERKFLIKFLSSSMRMTTSSSPPSITSVSLA